MGVFAQQIFVLARDGLTLRHKTFSILQEDDNFLE